ncbi:MAG: alanine racemase [Acidiferrobacterales bacterium]
MARPARVRLSAAALHHNFARVRAYAPDAKVMAVVKANGYGHGLTWVARALADADAFGVASVDEGLILRRAGTTSPICLLEGFFHADELPALSEYRLSTVVHHESQLWHLEQCAGIAPLDVWLKIDTGMHRIGFNPQQAVSAANRLRDCQAVGVLRLMSHFANADNRFDATTSFQIGLFEEITKALGGERSLANSAGIVAWPQSRLEWVRPGIMLYGVSPMIGQTAAQLGLRPVMTLQSEIIAVNRRRKGDTVGYGGDWVCPEDMPVGVVAIGYGDGYPRHAPTGTPVLVNGARATLIGRVSMDMITIDLRTLPDTKVGDPVVLWGDDLPVEEIATRCGTIGYELLCCVTPRVARVESDQDD